MKPKKDENMAFWGNYRRSGRVGMVRGHTDATAAAAAARPGSPHNSKRGNKNNRQTDGGFGLFSVDDRCGLSGTALWW